MKTIWKYPLNPGENKLTMPVDAKLLALHSQQNRPTLWALVDDKAEKEARTIITVGTGGHLPNDLLTAYDYLGTCLVDDDRCVVHAFEHKVQP